MIRALTTATLLLLAACGQQASDAAPAGDDEPNPIAAAAPNLADCARVTLDLTRDRFDEGRENFAVGTEARTKLDANFAAALASACAKGLLAKVPLVDPRSEPKDTLFIANAPEANIASIYFNGVQTVFEGPFFVEGRHVQVSGPDAIEEAIYCHTIGASEAEQETTGRCLPD